MSRIDDFLDGYKPNRIDSFLDEEDEDKKKKDRINSFLDAVEQPNPKVSKSIWDTPTPEPDIPSFAKERVDYKPPQPASDTGGQTATIMKKRETMLPSELAAMRQKNMVKETSMRAMTSVEEFLNERLPISPSEELAGQVEQRFGEKPVTRVQERISEGVIKGATGTVKGVADFARVLGIDSAEKVSTAIEDFNNAITTVEDPNFIDSLASGVGSSLTFWIPGMGVVKGVQAAGYTARAAAMFGSAASAVMESAVEAGNVYDELVKAGKEDIATKAAWGVFASNLPANYLLDKWIFNRFPEGKRIVNTISGGLQEGTQEVYQEAVSDIFTGKPANLKKYLETFAVGGTIGLGGGAAKSTQPTAPMGDLLTPDQKLKLERLKQKLPEGIRTAGEELYTKVFDRFAPISNAGTQAKLRGMELSPGKDPFLQSKVYLASTKIAENMLETETFRHRDDGSIEVTGEGLKPILNDYQSKTAEKDTKVQEKDLNDYLIGRRLEAEQKAGIERVGEEGLNEKYRKIMEDLRSKYGDNISILDNASNRIYEYQKRILNLLVDGGNLSQAQYDNIIAKNPDYIPFQRVLEDAGITEVLTKKKGVFAGAKAPINKRKGSELEIEDVIPNVIKNTFLIYDRAQRNKVANSVYNLQGTLPDLVKDVTKEYINVTPMRGEQGERIAPKIRYMKPTGNVVELFVDGKRKYMELSKPLAQAMQGMESQGSNSIVKILSKPANWLRTGVTSAPYFPARNLIRDMFTAYLQTDVGFSPFDVFGAMKDLALGEDVVNDFVRSGSGYAGMVELSRQNMERVHKALTGNKSVASKLLDGMNIINHLQDISQLFEASTRLSVYKRAKGKGMSDIEAGVQAREATVDFNVKGSSRTLRGANALYPFFNAGLQGASKMTRSFLNAPAGYSAKAFASITIPSIILYAVNKDDPDYQNQPRWQKDLFWMIPVKGDDGKKLFVRIPKPFGPGQIYGSMVERFLDYTANNNPEAYKDFAKSLFQSFSPMEADLGSLLPVAIKPLMENDSNWNYFLERNIVPKSRESLAARYQYNIYTTKQSTRAASAVIDDITTALKISDKPVIRDLRSPAKLENIIRGYFGGTGTLAMGSADWLMKKMGKGDPRMKPTELADKPFVRGFVTRDVAISSDQPVQDFYKIREDVKEVKSTHSALIAEGQYDEAEKYLSKNKKDFEAYSVIEQYYDAMKQLSDSMNAVLSAKDLSEEERRDRYYELNKKRIGLALKAKLFYRGFKND